MTSSLACRFLGSFLYSLGNDIGESGLEALLKAVQYQTTLCMDNKTSGTGLMRLMVGVGTFIDYFL